MADGQKWTRDEVILAMNLYTRLNFGLFHSKNPEVIRLAGMIGRTPSSIALKLTNLASLDAYHRNRGVSGMANASKMDKQVWAEFQEDWEAMGLISEEAMAELEGLSSIEARVEEASESSTEKLLEVKTRTKQQFFRRAVLTSYQSRCCITGTPIPALLTASHILPWADFPKERLNPSNGLCLAKTQDAAFDRFLITLDEDYRVVVSKSIRDHMTVDSVRENFTRYEGQKISMPERFLPDQKFLEVHRERFSAA